MSMFFVTFADSSNDMKVCEALDQCQATLKRHLLAFDGSLTIKAILTDFLSLQGGKTQCRDQSSNSCSK